MLAPLGSAQTANGSLEQFWPAFGMPTLRLAVKTIDDGARSAALVPGNVPTAGGGLTAVGVGVGVPATKGATGTVHRGVLTSSSSSGSSCGKPPPLTVFGGTITSCNGADPGAAGGMRKSRLNEKQYSAPPTV